MEATEPFMTVDEFIELCGDDDWLRDYGIDVFREDGCRFRQLVTLGHMIRLAAGQECRDRATEIAIRIGESCVSPANDVHILTGSYYHFITHRATTNSSAGRVSLPRTHAGPRSP